MAILKTDAVVLKGWNLGETSRILSLFTRDFGKIRVVAKGARGPKSKFKGCLESLTHIRITYYDRRTRDLQLLSNADLVNPHFRIIGDIGKTTLAMASAELIERAVTGEEAHPAVFDLLAETLDHIDRSRGFTEGHLWKFEQRFIDLMGFKATWHRCLKCGESLGMEGGYFQPERGGLFCTRCGAARGGLQVSPETLEILFWQEAGEREETEDLRPASAQKAEIRKVFELYFKTHIPYMGHLRSLTLFYQLTENSGGNRAEKGGVRVGYRF